jgi:hypothetical protein
MKAPSSRNLSHVNSFTHDIFSSTTSSTRISNVADTRLNDTGESCFLGSNLTLQIRTDSISASVFAPPNMEEGPIVSHLSNL